MAGKLWGGCFSGESSEGESLALMERLNASINFDRRLYRQDIKASIAHTAMLASQGIISADEAEILKRGLRRIRQEIDEGKMRWDTALEDIHTHVETRLNEVVGAVAGKLHTARSRNDQAATDLRLWVMDSIVEVKAAVTEWQKALLQSAERHIDVIMPGYTHLQRAQPVLFSHHLLAYVEMASRDKQRLDDCSKRASVLPLGAAALAGTTYDVNPMTVAAELGFSAVFNNSMDAVSDRDFAVEFVFACALIQTHLSRLAEEIVLWSSSEFAFIRVSDEFSTGSSIMPQKRNPDAAELIRAKTGRVNGDLIALLTMIKALPLAYNKDLQEDKEQIFDAFDTVTGCLRVMAAMLDGITVRADKMRQAIKEGFLNATELADYLAAKGVPFRRAHYLAGQAVLMAEAKNCALEDLDLSELRTLSELIADDVFILLRPEQAVARRQSRGGTAVELVRQAIIKARENL
jgi:argininosuccinate lyase